MKVRVTDKAVDLGELGERHAIDRVVRVQIDRQGIITHEVAMAWKMVTFENDFGLVGLDPLLNAIVTLQVAFEQYAAGTAGVLVAV